MRGCHGGRDFVVQPDDRRRFLKCFERTDGCWLWKRFSQRGYGRFHVASTGKSMLAHRVSYVIHKGQIPAGMLVMHTCDNPSCVNPDHLVLGTQSDNLADMRRKGRQPRGGYTRRRKERCVRGHRLSGRNVREYQYGGHTRRACIACARWHSLRKNEIASRARAEESRRAMTGHVIPYLPESFASLVALTDLRRAEVFCSNYGVFGHDSKTLTDIGTRYGITRERARQLVNDVLVKLNIPLHKRRYAHAA